MQQPTKRYGQLNPITLAFRDKSLESSYGDWGFAASKQGFELALRMSSAAFMLLLVVDYLILGEFVTTIVLIRLLAFPGANALIYLLMQLKPLQRRGGLDLLHTIFILVTQVWQFWIAIAYPALGSQYLGLMLMLSMMGAVTFNKLYFRYLFPALVLVMAAFFLAIHRWIDMPPGEVGFQVLLTSMFAGISMASGYRMERAARLDYISKLEITQKQNALLAKNKELEQFAYIASHDLQEPLRSVTSFSQLINEEYRGEIGEDGGRYLDFLMEASGRMRNLIKGLLDYSRLGREAKLVQIDANATLRAIQVDLSVAITESQARITSDPLPTLQVFETEFRQLLQNLLSNALKFRRKDTAPEVHISAQRQRNFWEFTVRDNGIGIAKESQAKIFLIFQRLHTRSQYEGTGIGLANCRKIVELHGGSIWVESEKNQGSTFYFTIPIRTNG
jgi:signal transduction histidine kinase